MLGLSVKKILKCILFLKLNDQALFIDKISRHYKIIQHLTLFISFFFRTHELSFIQGNVQDIFKLVTCLYQTML